MDDSHLKDDAFTAVKRDAKFYTRYVKGVPFVNKGVQKGYLFREKWYIKGKGWTSGGASPSKSTPWARYMVRERAIRYSVNTTLTSTELLKTDKKLELCLANLFCFTDLDAFHFVPTLTIGSRVISRNIIDSIIKFVLFYIYLIV